MLVAQRSRFDALLRMVTFALIAVGLSFGFDDRTFLYWFFARLATTLLAGTCITRFQKHPTPGRFVAVFLAYVLDAFVFFWLVFYFWLTFEPHYQLISVLMLAAAFIYSLTHRLRVPSLGLIYVVGIQLSFSLFWVTLLIGERAPTDVGLAITVMGLQFYHALTMHETFSTLATIDRDARRGEAARKLEAMGRVAGGVAHAFNNHLTTIVGGIDLARSRRPSPEAQRTLGLAMEAARNASQDVSRLLAYTHQLPLQPAQCHLADVLSELEAHHRSRSHPREIAFSAEVSPELPLLHVDREQLLAALTELLDNAVHAGADQITVRGSISSDADSAIDVKMSDNGTGVAPQIAERVFDPFFSESAAKPGLGLSMVKGFTEQSGGDVTLYPSEGGDTTFVLRLPIEGSTTAYDR